MNQQTASPAKEVRVSAGSREAMRRFARERFENRHALYPLIDHEAERPLGAAESRHPTWNAEQCLQAVCFERDGLVAAKTKADTLARKCYARQERAHGFRLVGTLLLASANIATFITVSETSTLAFAASLVAVVGSVCLVCFELYSVRGGGSRSTGELLVHLDRTDTLLRQIDRMFLLADTGKSSVQMAEAVRVREDAEAILSDLLRLVTRLERNENDPTPEI